MAVLLTMEAIKTYHDVNRQDASSSFGISRMEEIHAKHGGKPDEPHRHDFYTAILVLDAEGQHFIDFAEYELNGGRVFFISPGQVHQIIEQRESKGYVMVFSAQFLAENNIPVRFIDDLNLFNNYGDAPPLTVDEDKQKTLSSLCEDMIRFYRSDLKFRDQALGSLLRLFLIESNNLCTIEDHPQQLESSQRIIRDFRELVNEKYTDWHGTSDYASALNITPDYLNRVVRSYIGKTAKEYIQSRITTAAKRLLFFSDLSIKEISYELGFSEPAHFSTFFKNCSGESPAQFKKSH